jgi:hypothetical protein
MKKFTLLLLVAVSANAYAQSPEHPFTPPEQKRSLAGVPQAESIFLRARAGFAFYSNTGQISSAFGYGLDLGFALGNGFVLTGMGRLNISANHITSTSSTTINSITTPGTFSGSKLDSKFFGVAPGFQVNKGIATVTFGVGIGALLTNSGSLETTSSLGSESAIPTESRSKFALAPAMDLDLDLLAGVSANLGISYIASVGSDPRLSFFLPMAGIGYRF